MDKIPTAEEFLRNKTVLTNKNLHPCKTYIKQGSLYADEVLPKMLVEFTKLHVKAALEAAAKNGKEVWDWTTEECNSIIKDSYPLSNIK